MNILLSNDDGFDAAGLRALFDAATAFGRPVVVAPRRPHSMKSHAITVNADISVETIQDPHLGTCFICDATPADCVRLALRFLPLEPVDLVLAGINHGGNAGVDVLYSGTVAAAREATLLGINALAVSQLRRRGRPDNWPRSSSMAAEVLREILPTLNASANARLLNINLPDPQSGATARGLRHCPLTPDALAVRFEELPKGAAQQRLVRYSGRYFDRPAPPGYDFACLLDDWITVTALRTDLTAPDREDFEP